MTHAEAKAERNAARQLYLWSLLLPALAIPLVCLGPAIVLLPLVYLYFLISGFRSKHSFVRWHAGQWLGLSLGWGALAVGSAMLFVASAMRGSSSLVVCLGSLVIGGGWWLSNLFGVWQVSQGNCWIWSMWSASAPLPRSWNQPASSATVAQAASPTDWQSLLTNGRTMSNYSHRHMEAVECFMRVFQAGPLSLRRQAVVELERLGEVEIF